MKEEYTYLSLDNSGVVSNMESILDAGWQIVGYKYEPPGGRWYDTYTFVVVKPAEES